MGRIRLDSINDFARHGYAVRVTCLGCGNVADWKATELVMVLAKQRGSLRVESVEHRMRCSNCGKRRAHIQPAIVDW